MKSFIRRLFSILMFIISLMVVLIWGWFHYLGREDLRNEALKLVGEEAKLKIYQIQKKKHQKVSKVSSEEKEWIATHMLPHLLKGCDDLNLKPFKMALLKPRNTSFKELQDPGIAFFIEGSLTSTLSLFEWMEKMNHPLEYEQFTIYALSKDKVAVEIKLRDWVMAKKDLLA